MVAASGVHMNNDRASHAVFAANVVYFAAAAVATVYVVAEAWHYGFWFTPFPLLLTLIGLAFIGATTMGTLRVSRGVVRWVSLGTFLTMLSFAAEHGAFFATHASFEKMLAIMLAIIGAEAATLVVAVQRGRLHSARAPVSERSISVIRKVALLLPLPIIALAGLQFYFQELPVNSPFMRQATTTYLISQRILFGLKRADELCCRLVAINMRQGNVAQAELYAQYALLNAEHPILRLDPSDVSRRDRERHLLLAGVYAAEGKFSAAREQHELYCHGHR